MPLGAADLPSAEEQAKFSAAKAEAKRKAAETERRRSKARVETKAAAGMSPAPVSEESEAGPPPPKRPRRTRNEASGKADEAKFWGHFPGAAKLLRKAGTDGRKELNFFIRTDGVSVSVSYRKIGVPAKPPLTQKAHVPCDLDEEKPTADEASPAATLRLH